MSSCLLGSQMSVDQFQKYYTILENKTIFELTSNFHFLTIVIFGPVDKGPGKSLTKHSLNANTKISMTNTAFTLIRYFPQN